MPQTKESIKFCQNADVPIIVAINKMDKEAANPDRVKNDLAEFGITPEDWGGDTMFVPISALKGDGVDSLLESISLLAEMQNFVQNLKVRLKESLLNQKLSQGVASCYSSCSKGTLKKVIV